MCLIQTMELIFASLTVITVNLDYGWGAEGETKIYHK